MVIVTKCDYVSIVWYLVYVFGKKSHLNQTTVNYSLEECLKGNEMQTKRETLQSIDVSANVHIVTRLRLWAVI